MFFFSVLQMTFATIFISIHIKILGTLIYICVSYDRLKGYHIQLKLIRYVTSGSLTFFCHLSSFRRAMTSVFSSPTSTQSRCTNINWWTLSFISWRKLTRRSVKWSCLSTPELVLSLRSSSKISERENPQEYIPCNSGCHCGVSTSRQRGDKIRSAKRSGETLECAVKMCRPMRLCPFTFKMPLCSKILMFVHNQYLLPLEHKSGQVLKKDMCNQYLWAQGNMEF